MKNRAKDAPCRNRWIGAHCGKRIEARSSLAAVAAIGVLLAGPAALFAQGGAPANPDPHSAALNKELHESIEPASYSELTQSTTLNDSVFNASVVRVLNDNTILVRPEGKDHDVTVRLYGVRPLPVHMPDGQRAQDYLTGQLKNAKVRVQGRTNEVSGHMDALVTLVPPPPPNRLNSDPDPTGISSDFPYGPAAATPNPPQAMRTLNETVLRLGLGRYDAQQAPKDKALAGAEQAAQKDKKGFWANNAAGTISSAEQPGRSQPQ